MTLFEFEGDARRSLEEMVAFTMAFTARLPDGEARARMTLWVQDVRDEVHIASRVLDGLVAQATEDLATGVTIKPEFFP